MQKLTNRCAALLLGLTTPPWIIFTNFSITFF